MFTALTNSRGFAAFATTVCSVCALVNGVALVLGVVLGHVGYRTIGQAAGLIIFAFLAMRYAGRWRNTPPVHRQQRWSGDEAGYRRRRTSDR